MSETNNEKEDDKGAKTTTADNAAGVQSYSSELVRRADEARKGLADENTRMEKNLAELRELTARDILGGSTNSGNPDKKKEDVSVRDYAAMVLAGKLPKKE